jgi:ABC-type nitrate/sulfonate/bicarbonate transport system permease component
MSVLSEHTADIADLEDGRVSWAAWFKSHPNLIRAASVVVFFFAWEYLARDSNPLFMTYPTAVFKAAWQLTLDGELQQALIESVVPFAVGLAIAIVGGILLGIAIGQSWLLEYTLDPFINALYAIPRVALIPLIILWAGLETNGKIVIVASIAIFPVIVNTYSGITALPNSRFSPRSCCRRRCRTSWQAYGLRSVSPLSARSRPSFSPR